MVKAIRTIICKHCKKQIKGKLKLVGLTLICPFCERPCEEISLLEEKLELVRKIEANLINETNTSNLRAGIDY